jgi:hypothetical protein
LSLLRHYDEAKRLHELKGAVVGTSATRFFRAIRKPDFSLLLLMIELGDSFRYINQ